MKLFYIVISWLLFLFVLFCFNLRLKAIMTERIHRMEIEELKAQLKEIQDEKCNCRCAGKMEIEK